MASTVKELRQRIEHLEREVSSLRTAIAQAEQPRDLPPIRRNEWLPGIWVIDPESARPHIDRAFEQMGIDITQPPPSAEELQELMLREGVNPEDCLGSRGIIEARDE